MTTLTRFLASPAPPAPAPASEPEAALLDAARRGDAGPLFEAYKDWVFSVAIHLTGDPAEAADVSQDVFVKLLAQLHDFDGGRARFTTWLYRIVCRTAADRSRSWRATAAIRRWWRERRSRADAASRPDEIAERSEVRDRVRAALSALDPDVRAALTLRYVARLSYIEVGEVLGLAPGTVATRIRRGHRELGARLRECTGDEGGGR